MLPAPVKVIVCGAPFWQTANGPLMNAVGKGFTLMITAPTCGCEQFVEEASITLIKVYVNVPGTLVGALTVTELPLVLVTVRLGPPLTV